MRFLLDTHVALWWLRADERLSPLALSLVADRRNAPLWSLASAFEVAIKVGIGKLDLGAPIERFYASLLADEGFAPLAVEHAHCAELSRLPLHHRDPFDRMLVAQARAEQIPLLSADPKLRSYDVDLRW